VTGRLKGRSSNYVETQVISPAASHSGVQEECHSIVQDTLQPSPDSGIEKYGTKVQEDHSEYPIIQLTQRIFKYANNELILKFPNSII